MNMTLKEIREGADAIGSVANKAELREAVKLLVAGCDRLAEMGKTIKVVAKALGKLNEKCSSYALEHPACFDGGGLAVSQIGVLSGDLTVDGETYHFASGYGTPVRADGQPMTQGFLSGLPDKWTKAMLHLDTTGIMQLLGKGEKFAEEIAKHGLVRPAKNQWTAVVDGESSES